MREVMRVCVCVLYFIKPSNYVFFASGVNLRPINVVVYSIYVNHLPKVIQNCDLTYADDMEMHCSIPDDLLGRLYRMFVLLIMDVIGMPSSAMHFKQLERIHLKFSNLRSTAYSSVTITLTEQGTAAEKHYFYIY